MAFCYRKFFPDRDNADLNMRGFFVMILLLICSHFSFADLSSHAQRLFCHTQDEAIKDVAISGYQWLSVVIRKSFVSRESA